MPVDLRVASDPHTGCLDAGRAAVSSTASTISPLPDSSSRDTSIQSPACALGMLPQPVSLVPPLPSLPLQALSEEGPSRAERHSKEEMKQVPSTPKGTCGIPPAAQRQQYARCGSSSQVGGDLFGAVAGNTVQQDMFVAAAASQQA